MSLKADVTKGKSANNHAYVTSRYCDSLQILKKYFNSVFCTEGQAVDVDFY